MAANIEYLRAMGIQVWVPRTGLISQVAAAAPTEEPDAREESDDRFGDPVSFDLCMVAYGELGLVFEKPADDRGGNWRQLCDDIAMAWAGRRVQGRMEMPGLPGPGAGDTNGDEAGAARAVARRLASLADNVVVFGAPDLFGVETQDDEIVERFGKRVLMAPELRQLLDEPLMKRGLWQGLVRLRGSR